MPFPRYVVLNFCTSSKQGAQCGEGTAEEEVVEGLIKYGYNKCSRKRFPIM